MIHIIRPVFTTLSPSQTMATTGPEFMYFTSPGKKGRSFRCSSEARRNFMAARRNPFCSKRLMILPTRPHCTPSDLMAMKLLNVKYGVLLDFNSATNQIAILQEDRHLYSRGASNRSQLKWRLSSPASLTLKTSTPHAYGHTSTEEEVFHLQLSPAQVKDMLRADESFYKWLKHPGGSIYKDATSVHLDHFQVYWQKLLDLHMEMGLSTEEALMYSFQRLDSDLSLEIQAPLEDGMTKNLSLHVAFSGATACKAHVNGVHLTPGLFLEDNRVWSCLPLTCDHNAWNETELSRLKRKHLESENRSLIIDDRLLGVLIPCRAFWLKGSKELQRSVLGRDFETEALNIYQFIPPHYYPPPSLTAKPEVTYHRLRPQGELRVLASDGLWDMPGNADVVRLVVGTCPRPHLDQRPANLGLMQSLLLQRKASGLYAADQNAAMRLIRHAIRSNEYGEMEPERLAPMLRYQKLCKRQHYDNEKLRAVKRGCKSHPTGEDSGKISEWEPRRFLYA
ncbi:LOW QUALITY PROTEIN: hypothetical protein U0070_005186 [Myodes glareolus]|uniref:PPM-type phosphatase domain-containing protein n=1 Tax=Myodes glareolus TaxID=447135 RepID=A0AAW0IGE9_MYOGA